MSLHPEAVFLDIGSNIGAYTVPGGNSEPGIVSSVWGGGVGGGLMGGLRVILGSMKHIALFQVPTLVASMRRRVVAVDMMMDNLVFIKTSLSQGSLDNYVELVHNAVR